MIETGDWVCRKPAATNPNRFRWDWRTLGQDDPHSGPGTTLELFYVLQRKGIFLRNTVTVTPEDEPAVRAWLKERLDHLLRLWEPIT